MANESFLTFQSAVSGFRSLVSDLQPQHWNMAGLGVWSVRDLVGHTTRAISTVGDYLEKPAKGEPEVAGPVAYLESALHQGDMAQIHADVARRGREAGAALGDDPAKHVDELAARVLEKAAVASDDTLIVSRPGTIRLVHYLPTRTFELAIHSLDISRATGVAMSPEFDEPLRSAGHLCIDVAQSEGRLADVLMATLGRGPLSEAFSLL